MMTPSELKAARRALGLNGVAFGKAFEVDPRTLRRWERGERPIPRSIAVLVRLAASHAYVRQELGIVSRHAKGTTEGHQERPGQA